MHARVNEMPKLPIQTWNFRNKTNPKNIEIYSWRCFPRCVNLESNGNLIFLVYPWIWVLLVLLDEMSKLPTQTWKSIKKTILKSVHKDFILEGCFPRLLVEEMSKLPIQTWTSQGKNQLKECRNLFLRHIFQGVSTSNWMETLLF